MTSKRKQTKKDNNRESAPSTEITLSGSDAISVLERGEVIGGYRLPWGSNYTFLVHLDAGEDQHIKAIYKPRDGERPLHDYPTGTLYRRERAAFLLSSILGWPNIPHTIVRDGPYGLGSMQLFIESNPEITYFDLRENMLAEFETFAVFDVIANNGDRKGGHCLLDNDGSLWSIDHGLTFHRAFKMRTVMLEYWGKTISENIANDLKSLIQKDTLPHNNLRETFSTLLSTGEIDALLKRVEIIVDRREIPIMDPSRDVPWPYI